MALDTRHAAWQTQRTYAVQLLAPGEAARGLVDGLDDYADALDFAKEWLYRLDSVRDGSTRLAIIEISGEATREVWSYPSAESGAAEAHDHGQELVKVFGFNPATWKSNVREFSTTEEKRSLRDRISTTGNTDVAPRVRPDVRPPARQLQPRPAPRQPARVVPAARPAPPAVNSEVAKAAPASTYENVITTARRAWSDRVTRCLLVAAFATLWFALVATDIRVLLVLVLFAPPMWYRLRQPPSTGSDATFDDWT